MDIFLVVLCVIALLLLFAGKREGLDETVVSAAKRPPPPSPTGATGPPPISSLPPIAGAGLPEQVSLPPAPAVTSMSAPLPDAMPTPTGGNTLYTLPIPGMPGPQAASVMTSTPVGAPLGSGMPHGILLTMV